MSITRIINLHSKGLPASKIAERLEVDKKSVYKAIREAGLEVRPPGRPGVESLHPERAREFREQYAVIGTTLKKAAKMAGVPYYAARRLARKDRKARGIKKEAK